MTQMQCGSVKNVRWATTKIALATLTASLVQSIHTYLFMEATFLHNLKGVQISRLLRAAVESAQIANAYQVIMDWARQAVQYVRKANTMTKVTCNLARSVESIVTTQIQKVHFFLLVRSVFLIVLLWGPQIQQTQPVNVMLATQAQTVPSALHALPENTSPRLEVPNVPIAQKASTLLSLQQQVIFASHVLPANTLKTQEIHKSPSVQTASQENFPRRRQQQVSMFVNSVSLASIKWALVLIWNHHARCVQ